MTVALSISDNADGTGGVATVAGSAVGSANTVYAAPFTGATGTPAWSSAGTRTGDGTVAVSPGTGYWLWYLDSLSAGSHSLSNVVYQNLSDASAGSASVHYRCLVAAQTVVRSLNLVASSSVYVGWVPRNLTSIDPLPGIAINPFGREGQLGVLTGRDDIGYPVLVSMFDAQAQGNQENLARDLLWRQKIFRAFRNQRLAGVPEIINADVSPDPVVDIGSYSSNLWVSSLLVNFRSREVRGLS